MKVKRTERHIITKFHKHFKEIDELCFKSKNLYNYANYLIRQEFIFNKKYLNYKRKDGRNILIYSNQTISKKFLKNNIIKPLKSNIQIKTKQENIKQIRFVPQTNCYVCEIVYEKETKEYKNLKIENFLSIDLGVNNFATCFNNQGLRPFIVNGGIPKSINQFYNKELARLMNLVKGQSKTSNRIRKLIFKRNKKMNDFIHKSSRRVVDYCLKNNIKNIVIGYNEKWKQNVNRGRQNNQNFVCIPFLKFVNQIKYKCEDVGINVFLTEESYTSKCDHLAFEKMEYQEEYLGDRAKRGLFISSTGKFLNADVNGSIGIFRKVIGDEVLKETLINRGAVFVPVKMNNLNESFC